MASNDRDDRTNRPRHADGVFGNPVRAIVPGHYGMASVKWLTGIHAVREPFHGYWQRSDYGYWDRLDGTPVRRALGEMKVMAFHTTRIPFGDSPVLG
jgi:DMSO/TMAO reductase YedYZ molybdopterin-dependent catalytic subunit